MDALTACLGDLIDGLVAGGVREAVVTPGSRSTPLALLMAREPRVRVWMHYDERSAGYFGLGLADALGEPVALVCTSGTAAANFLPAVVEASLAGLPLVVLTADRPPELREVGAPQTIEQRHLYGTHARWFYECPLPDPELAERRVFGRAGERAARRTREAAPGPVHVNVPLREPLLPAAEAAPARTAEPWPAPVGAPVSLAPLVARLRGRRGVVVAGASDVSGGAAAILSLADALAWPVLADPLANLREPYANRVLAHHDLWLRGRAAEALRPEAAVRFGAPPVSKVLNQWLSGVETVVVDVAGRHRDPTFSGRAEIPVTSFAALEPVAGMAHTTGPWLVRWRACERAAGERLASALAELPNAGASFEGRLWSELGPALAGYQALLVGNSMPVRDMDSFFPGAWSRLPVYGQRGASGIDGVLSHAMGLAAGRGRTLAVLGDLSFYHDMNGLLAAHLNRLPATVVVINNRGGGIFSLLPQRRELPEDEFERLFGTPHALDFEAAARVYGVGYARFDDVSSLIAAVAEAAGSPGTVLLEWDVGSRAANADWHGHVARAVARAAEAVLGVVSHADD